MPSAAAILPANVNSGRVSDAKSADTQAAEQPFGQVLAQEVARQDEAPKEEGVSAVGAGIKEGTGDAESESLAESVTQDSSLLPWLALISQQVSAVPVKDVAVAQAVVGGVQVGSSQPVAGVSLPLASDVGERVASMSGEAVLELNSEASRSSLEMVSQMPSGDPLAANPATDTGKALPDEVQFSLEQMSLSERFSMSTDSKETPAEPSWLASVVSGEAPTPSAPFGAESAGKTQARHVVHEPVGDTRWGEVVAQRVSMMLGKQEQQVEMQLTPPNLGPMEVRLTLGQEQASVVFASQHAAVREALATAVPRLTALLADQGIQLVNVQVASDSLQQQAQNPSSQQQSFSFSGNGQGARGESAFRSDVSVSRNLSELALPVARSGVSLYV